MKIPERVENGLDMDPDGQVAVEGAVRTVAFCPCKWNSSLLAVGSSDRVTVFSLKFPASDEGSDQGELAVEVVRRFAHKEPVCSVAWSPNMSLVLSPVCMRFATASSDGKVRIFCSNLQEKDDISVLDGHRGPVNAVAWEPHSGEAVASVGDDNTCRVWGLDGEQRACLVLRSPGTAVAWHPDEAGKVQTCPCRESFVPAAGGGEAWHPAAVQRPELAAPHVPGHGPTGGAIAVRRLVRLQQPAARGRRRPFLVPLGDCPLQPAPGAEGRTPRRRDGLLLLARPRGPVRHPGLPGQPGAGAQPPDGSGAAHERPVCGVRPQLAPQAPHRGLWRGRKGPPLQGHFVLRGRLRGRNKDASRGFPARQCLNELDLCTTRGTLMAQSHAEKKLTFWATSKKKRGCYNRASRLEIFCVCQENAGIFHLSASHLSNDRCSLAFVIAYALGDNGL
ncbi:unnamed protein product [Ixodes persulcatus]